MVQEVGERDNVGACLWRPDERRIGASNLAHFVASASLPPALTCSDYESLHRWSIENTEAFWRAVWSFCAVRGEPGERVLLHAERMPGARWFPDARLNFAENLLRRDDDDDAIVSWTEDGLQHRLSWRELRIEVAEVAAGLQRAGVQRGDRVAAYLPNVAETVVAMLATASIGATWASCSPDFGVEEVVERLAQIEPKALFVCDGFRAGGTRVDITDKVAEIIARLPSLACAVLASSGSPAPSDSRLTGVVRFEHFRVAGVALPQPMPQLPFDHPLFIVFSSGTTGKPKCIVHGAGGTLLQHLKEHQLHSDVKRGDRVFYYTTCGWMMWNWLVSALASEATIILYEGSPFARNGGMLFDLIDHERITHFGVSAKYLDTVAKLGLRPRDSHSLHTLRAVLSTGSPLLPECFDFVYRDIKSDVCLSSISGGTDIISCFVLGCPTLPVRRGEVQCLGLGMSVEAFDEEGKSVVGAKAELVCTRPFPSMPLGFWNDPDGAKYRAAYFEHFPNVWRHGDYVEIVEHPEARGMIIYGRSDAVLKPGGVRIGTAEIYRYVQQIGEVADSLVVGQEWRGDVRIVLYVKLRDGLRLDKPLVEKIRVHLRRNASPAHVPALVLQVGDIPRTRSNKVVELIVRDLIHGRPIKNREALANPEALDQFRAHPELYSDAESEGSELELPVFTPKWVERGLISTTAAPSDLAELTNAATQLEGVVAGLREQSSELEQLEALSLDYVLAALNRLGWNANLGERVSTEELSSRLGIDASQQRLFNRILEVLAARGYLLSIGQHWRVERSWSTARVAVEEARARHGNMHRELALVSRCGEQLARVLRGECDPLSLLFPEGEAGEMAALYRESPAFGTFNALIPQTVRALLDGQAPHRAVRILELGAGTGGTTAHVVPHLDPARTEYFVTDVGAYFLNHARAAFAEHSFLRYAVLDVERTIAEQHWGHGKFDLIIAANVLHATADLTKTLANVRALLNPGGVLLLLEGAQPRLWLDITFGLTEGWWLFGDHDLRPNYPLLSPSAWQRVLQTAGFDAVTATLPQGDFLMPQSVVMARVPTEAEQGSSEDSWLFITRDESGERLVEAMRARGHRCIHATVGDEAGTSTHDELRIASGNGPQMSQMLRSALQQTRERLRGIVLCPAGADLNEIRTASDVIVTQQRACEDALNLLHALLATNLTHIPRLWLATRDATAAAESQVSGVALAPLRGLALSIALEHPEFRCTSVDLPVPLRSADLRALCDELESESNEDRLAIRDGHRFVARLARAKPATIAAPPPIRDDGLYLITGGFGPLGLLFAQRLAAEGARHIALVGRNATRPDAENVIEHLRRAGVTLTTAAVDVSREDEVRSLFARLKDAHPPLAGVLHCAGVLDDGVLMEQSWKRFAPLFAPKVAGAWNLHAATRAMSLDFFVLFSSTAAMLGHAGQANHSAANSFLDALAHARRASGLPALSVNWGSWSRIGAAANERILDQLARQGIRPISPEQGVAALEWVLGSGLVQAVVADIDVATAAQSRARAMLLADLQSIAVERPQQPAAQFRAHLDQAPRESRLSLLTEHVRGEIARLAGIADVGRIDDETGFFELGMDSLTSVELRNRLQRSFGKTLPATLAFDYPNIRAFVAYLRDHVFGPEYFSEEPAAAFAPIDTPNGAEGSLDESIERELAELNALLGTTR